MTEPAAEFNSIEFWIYVGSTFALLVLCSLTSALNGSLLELDATHLEILHRSGTPDIQRQAVRAQRILKHHHLVIFSLVLLHAAADEALPILLSYVMPNEYTAIAVAVPLVLLFGELVPATVISGRALRITSIFYPIVWISVGITGIITAPLAYIAHHIAGGDSKLTIRNYRRNEITEFLRLHVGNSGKNMKRDYDDDQSLLEENLLSESRRTSFEEHDDNDYNNDDDEYGTRNTNNVTSKYRSKRNLLNIASSVSSSASMFKPLLSESDNEESLNYNHSTNAKETSSKRNLLFPQGNVHPKVTIHSTDNKNSSSNNGNIISSTPTDKSDPATINTATLFSSHHPRYPSGEGISMMVRSSPPASATPSLTIPTTNHPIDLLPLVPPIGTATTTAIVPSVTDTIPHASLPPLSLSQPSTTITKPSSIQHHYHHINSHSRLPRTESDSTNRSVGTVDTITNDSRNSSFDDTIVVHRHLSNHSATSSDHHPRHSFELHHDSIILPHHHHSHEHHAETHTSHHTTGALHAHQPPSLPPLMEEKSKSSRVFSTNDSSSTVTHSHPPHKGFLKRWMSKHNIGSSGNGNNTDTDAHSGGSDYESATSHTSSVSHAKQDDSSTTRNGIGLTAHEVRVIEGTLGLAIRTVSMRMVPIHKLFALSSDDTLTRELLQKITSSAHSRIPVYEGTDRNAIVGLLLVKLLLSLDDFGVGVTIGSLPLIRPLVIHPDTSMLDALKAFEKGKSHMAIVTKETTVAEKALLEGVPIPSSSSVSMDKVDSISTDALPVTVLGIVTLEDCLLDVLNAGTGKQDNHHIHRNSHHYQNSHHHHHHHHGTSSSNNHHSSKVSREHPMRDTQSNDNSSSGLKREASASGIFSSVFSSLTGSTNTNTNEDSSDNHGHGNSSTNSGSRARSPLPVNEISANEGQHHDSLPGSNHHHHSSHHSTVGIRSRGSSISGLNGIHNGRPPISYSPSPVPTDDHYSSPLTLNSSHPEKYSHPVPISSHAHLHHRTTHHDSASHHDPPVLSSPPTDAPLNLISDAHEMRALLKHWEQTKSRRILTRNETTTTVSNNSTPIPSTPNEVSIATEPEESLPPDNEVKENNDA